MIVRRLLERATMRLFNCSYREMLELPAEVVRDHLLIEQYTRHARQDV